jgi:hypothetical protein
MSRLNKYRFWSVSGPGQPGNADRRLSSSPNQKNYDNPTQTNRMHQVLRDTVGLGILFWLIGYLASMVLYFSPFSSSMGWIILVIFTPFTVWVTWWWFRQRDPRSLQYYAVVGFSWTLIAMVLDYLFIVLLFKSGTYYAADVFLYYILMFLIPVSVGIFLNRAGSGVSSGTQR